MEVIGPIGPHTEQGLTPQIEFQLINGNLSASITRTGSDTKVKNLGNTRTKRRERLTRRTW